MAELRTWRSTGRSPHEILDPRDLKYCRNQCDCDWDPAARPVSLAREAAVCPLGAGRIAVDGLSALGAGGRAGPGSPGIWAVVPAVLLGFVVYFFRDPRRRVPQEPGLLVSPADGNGGRDYAARARRFRRRAGGADRHLSCRFSTSTSIGSPAESRVIRLRYSPGEFLNALNPESAMRNENLWIGLEEESPPHRRLVVRQIAGLIARRIVCNLRSGELVAAGPEIRYDQAGLAHRTDLSGRGRTASPGQVGDKVKGAHGWPATMLWQWRTASRSVLASAVATVTSKT